MAEERAAAVKNVLLKLALLESGNDPETVPLGATACPRILTALEEGEPAIVTDGDGRSFLIYQKNGKYYMSLSRKLEAMEVSQEMVRNKLRDQNSEAILIHSIPDLTSLPDF